MYRATPLTEKATLKELGERIRAHRIALDLSRETLAEKAGIGKNTLVRLENGQSVGLSHLVKVLLEFGKAESLVEILPDYSQSPMMLLRESQKLPQRKRAGRKKNTVSTQWVWKEDE